MTTGFITYHSALGDARARLGDGCLRIALEAPLPAMRTLVYRLQVRGARDPIGTEEWSQIIDDLDELHEAEEATSVTNLRIETRKAMLEQMRKLLLADRDGRERHGEDADDEGEHEERGVDGLHRFSPPGSRAADTPGVSGSGARGGAAPEDDAGAARP
jgi:hypothetical protein